MRLELTDRTEGKKKGEKGSKLINVLALVKPKKSFYRLFGTKAQVAVSKCC